MHLSRSRISANTCLQSTRRIPWKSNRGHVHFPRIDEDNVISRDVCGVFRSMYNKITRHACYITMICSIGTRDVQKLMGYGKSD